MADISQIRRELQDTLHVELIPGTEIMTDVGNLSFQHSGSKVLIPQPSKALDDPLNWTFIWKAAVMGAVFLVSFTTGIGPLSCAPQIPYYIAEFERPLPDIVEFIGVAILVLGFSNFIWVPLARTMGRRPTLLISQAIAVGSAIWRAKATSYRSFLGACILSGIGYGPGETICPMLVADVMFLHQRGLYMGLYFWSYWGSFMIGPVIAGTMSERWGWRSFWWLNVALLVFTWFYILCCLPETYFPREDSIAVAAHSGSSTNHSTEDQEKAQKDGSFQSTESKHIEFDSSLESSGHRNLLQQKLGGPLKHQFLSVKAEQMSIREFVDFFWIPTKLMVFPIAQWGAFVLSFSASCFLVPNLTQSQAFPTPPWNFSPAQTGYTNLALYAGATIALLTGGWLSDLISTRATIRNKNIREPEMRLPTLIPFACMTLVGSIVIAFGYQYGWPWEAIVILGYTLLGLQTASITAIAVTYAVDCYKPIAGEFFLFATINKNLWAYGVSKFLNVWIVKVGYVKPIMTIMALTMFFILLAVPLYFYGKRVRTWTRDSSVHRK